MTAKADIDDSIKRQRIRVCPKNGILACLFTSVVEMRFLFQKLVLNPETRFLVGSAFVFLKRVSVPDTRFFFRSAFKFSGKRFVFLGIRFTFRIAFYFLNAVVSSMPFRIIGAAARGCALQIL